LLTELYVWGGALVRSFLSTPNPFLFDISHAKSFTLSLFALLQIFFFVLCAIIHGTACARWFHKSRQAKLNDWPEYVQPSSRRNTL
jgi:hypothetical protein